MNQQLHIPLDGVLRQLSNDLEKDIEKLDKQTLQDILVKASKRGARVLQKKAKYNLQGILKSGKQFDSSYTDAVRIKVDPITNEVSVHIMGKRSNTSANTFKVRFYEDGSKDRYTKGGHKQPNGAPKTDRRYGKGLYRGKITDNSARLHFFRDSTEQSQQEMIAEINQSLQKQIDAINK